MPEKKTKQRKKLPFICYILIAIVVLFTIILCSSISDEESSNAEGAGSTTPVVDIFEDILVDNEIIKASFVGAEDESSLGVFYVTLKIENKTDCDLAINLEDADVDGETIPLITTGVPLVIRPGNNGQASFIFSMVDLSISSMDDAESATFRIVARDNESFDTVYESEFVTVNLH